MEKICVAVRVRPSANEEIVNGFHWKVDSNRISLHRSHGTPISGVSYAFDHLFDQECSNGTVYKLLIKGIISAAMEGFNGTAFAYGQTSSGKTFTMNGSENDPGIIHRAVRDIFDKIEETSDREFLIRVSYMEIYNEEINDLFAVENQKLQIHESLVRGVFVAGLREEIVNSADQVLQLIQLGEANRHFGETNMNARSSRSHTIFRMVIESKGKDNKFDDSPDDAIRVSVLNLVDLAGSERVAKTGAGGVRLKEGKHINKSLMILGNVINKLSEGGKQSAHIPYRDSKLTRILQPALGGNAKTSIICTVAPEEIHIEESKGTLQFASRAKRITNCVQVNEILTDAALLKRQKIEIEDLRSKLQGSHAEVLEKEILKLRNDMLKYELEREKLATELEEERRSQKEREQWIKEQQMKIHNLNNLVTLSDSDRSSSDNGVKECLPDESTSSHSMRQEDAFSTPCLKTVPNGFVAKRSRYSSQPECSPLPDVFGDCADEDTWMKMNKGYIADLDSLHTTPSRKVQSFPFSEDCSMDNSNQEIQNLRRQLEFAIEERDELKRKYTEQVSFNDQLSREKSELQLEILTAREVPQKLLENVTHCKGIHNEVFSIIQKTVADEKSAVAQILATTTEVGTSLFSTLESHLLIAVDGKRPSPLNDCFVQEQYNMLHQKLSDAVYSLVSSDGSTMGDEHKENSHNSSNTKGTLGGVIACWKQALENEVGEIKHQYNDLEKELEVKNQLLEVSEGKLHSLEREFRLVKEDRDAMLQRTSSSSQMLQTLGNEVREIKHKHCDLEKELEGKNELLKVSEGKYQCMEREFHLVTEERDAVLERISSSSQTLRELENEVKEIKQKYSDLEKELGVKNQLLVVSERKYKSMESEFHLATEDRDATLERISSSSQMLQASENEVEEIKHKYNDLEKELEVKNQLLEVSEGKYLSMEREFHLVTEDRDEALERFSSSSQILHSLENEVEDIKHKHNDLEKELEVKSQLLEVSKEKYQNMERELHLVTEERDSALERICSSSQIVQALENKVKEIKHKHNDLEKELEVKSQLLDVSEEKYHSMEREFHLVTEERDAALERISSSSQILQALENEVEEIKQKSNDLEKELESKSQLLEVSEEKYQSMEREFRLVTEEQDAALERTSSSSHTFQGLENQVEEIKHKYDNLKKELDVKNQLLKVSEGKLHSLEREFCIVKEERDTMLRRISSSAQILTQVTGEKDRVLKELNTEVRRRKKLEEEIKQFNAAFACRQRSVTSFQSEFKSLLETMKTQNPTSLSKSHGS
ncbi:kinesin-like protein KIN-7N [Salvia divinorum]|uniref:Kinesin-like protein KIN-7N n=1 Tax=Salvia divinorum TaxID=28513 RepID=A0ABD1GRW6_SALDI